MPPQGSPHSVHGGTHRSVRICPPDVGPAARPPSPVTRRLPPQLCLLSWDSSSRRGPRARAAAGKGPGRGGCCPGWGDGSCGGDGGGGKSGRSGVWSRGSLGRAASGGPSRQPTDGDRWAGAQLTACAMCFSRCLPEGCGSAPKKLAKCAASLQGPLVLMQKPRA